MLLRALEDRGALETGEGRIAVGWLIVEDLATVLVLVLLPALAACSAATPGTAAAAGDRLVDAIGVTLAKVAAFVGVMFVVGRARCRGCSSASRAPARASSSRSPSSPSPWASPSARRRSSASRSRSAPSSPAS